MNQNRTKMASAMLDQLKANQKRILAQMGGAWMSQHNQLNWSDFLLCIGMELAFHKNGERPIQEQMIAEKLMELNGGEF